MSFNGAGLKHKIDPTLDFTAQTTAADATATLHITGFADAPQFDLSSTPPLPQDEILARLLFGESASQLTVLQVAQIGAALATLSGVGGGGPNPLAKVQKALGLDRLSVGGGSSTRCIRDADLRCERRGGPLRLQPRVRRCEAEHDRIQPGGGRRGSLEASEAADAARQRHGDHSGNDAGKRSGQQRRADVPVRVLRAPPRGVVCTARPALSRIAAPQPARERIDAFEVARSSALETKPDYDR